jgi:hypothetical protein
MISRCAAGGCSMDENGQHPTGKRVSPVDGNRLAAVIQTFNLVARKLSFTKPRDCRLCGNRSVKADSGHRPRADSYIAVEMLTKP